MHRYSFNWIKQNNITRYAYTHINKSSPLLLGRWRPNDNIEKKIDLANIDNCGDRVCGDIINKENYKEMLDIISIFDKRWNKDIDKDEFKKQISKYEKKK